MKNQAELLSSLLDMAEAMLMVGAEVSRVEDTVTRMGFAYGARHMNVFVITSCIMITMGMPEGEDLTQTRRVLMAGGTDFLKLEKFNDLSRRCCAGLVEPSAIAGEVREISSLTTGRWRRYLGSVLAAGSFSVFFGGSLLDGGVAALFALLICALQEKLLPISMNQLSFNLLCSVIVGVLTGLCTNLIPVLHLDKIMIGYIMLLIPGMAMTNAVRNVLGGNTISGVMRLIEAVLWAAALALGFMIAMFITGGGLHH